MAQALRQVKILGTGSYLPETVITNDDIAARGVDTNDEWIAQRTGIRARRAVSEGEATSDLCVRAARQALEAAGVEAGELDLIIVGTISPDMPMPSTACYVQRAIGAKKAACFDLAAACSGFVYALNMAQSAIAAGTVEKVLVMGAECLTRFLNWEDRGSCILFGDGAGAAVVGVAPEGDGAEVLYTFMQSDGSQAEDLWIPGGGSRYPASQETVDGKRHTIALDGRAIYKFAVKTFVKLISDAADAVGVPVSEIDCVVPHQVNARIIESSLEKLGLPMERVMVNIDKYGNTSAASVPIALDEAVRAGRIKRGDLVVMVAFGAGLTWGSIALRW